MSLVTFIGLLGGFLTTVAFLPQVIKTWKIRETKDLSLGTFVLQATATTLWVCYGLIIGELPLILWNMITVILVFIIIVFKLKYK